MPIWLVDMEQTKFVANPIGGIRCVVGKQLTIGIALEARFGVAFGVGVRGVRLTLSCGEQRQSSAIEPT